MNLRQTSLACRPAVCHIELRLSSHAGQEEWEGEKGRAEGGGERQTRDRTIVPSWAPVSTKYQTRPWKPPPNLLSLL